MVNQSTKKINKNKELSSKDIKKYENIELEKKYTWNIETNWMAF